MNPGRRVSPKAPVYVAGVLQYLVTEILDMAAGITRDDERVRITPRDILTIVSGDVELEALLRKVTIPFAGAHPPPVIRVVPSESVPMPTTPPTPMEAVTPMPNDGE